MQRADEKLAQLIHTAKELDRPTMIIFFGDHLPNLQKVYDDFHFFASDQDKIDKNQIVELKTKPLSRPKGGSSTGKATGGGKIGKSVGGFAIKWPVRWAGVNSGWGRRYHPIYGRYIFHQGIDTPVRYESCYAAADGTVSYAGNMSGYGKIIIIKHKNGYETRYAHMNKLSVRVGQSVKMGEYIGQTGATGKVTGPHLHFEVRLNGNSLNPMNFR